MSSPSMFAHLPDAVVRAIRKASKPFLSLQSSRYASAGTSNTEVDTLSLVMRTKTLLPQKASGQFDARDVLPSTWSEVYRSAVEELPDAQSKRLWGFVSTVLTVHEQGGTSDSVNASAAIVEWNDRFSSRLDDVEEVVAYLYRTSPLHLDDAEVEDIGSGVLGRIEDAFLTGHFEAAATLMDALLTFLRRGQSSLLSAEVETALADVRRILDTAFHDSDSHQNVWVRSANAQLQESRNTLMNPSGGPSSGNRSAVDALVEDLCATCVDVLILITKDATRLVERCRESRRSAVDFLVAICAIMEPYATLSRVAAIYAEYVGEWDNYDNDDDRSYNDSEEDERWYCAAVQAVLEVESLTGMVDAMERVAQISFNASLQGGEREAMLPAPSASGRGTGAAGTQGGSRPVYNSGGRRSDGDDDVYDDDSASDTVSVSEVAAAATTAASLTPFQARHFTVVCMAAHIADLCAPAIVASFAADIHLTFTRNNLVSAYAELFAFHPRTWRVAGLYACYSPLINPRFLVDIVETVAPSAAVDEVTYRSLHAFFLGSWSTHSDHQAAVRAKLEAVLPGNATVSKWWAAVDFCYTEAFRKVHRYIIVTLLNHKRWSQAAWLAVETGLTETLHSHLQQIMTSSDALVSEELYAVGCAVQRAFVSVDCCPSAELTRYLCAAAALAAYRQAATTVNAALESVAPAQVGTSVTATPSVDVVVKAVVVCLQAIEAALKTTDECASMLHPATTFTLVEHGASLLLSLRQLMRDPVTGDSTGSMHVSSCVLPLLVEAYQLSSIHFGSCADPAWEKRGVALGEKLANVHQTCI
ncbi:hypothetical protein ABB37_00343 [Leptomonas pyrrhocoris]|uniref:Nuclear pore complex protein n=1 Tax=Leptomonas pyrrhocoris TaxID=157538 RepID=A0A0M9GAJ1_LEPPY|nr:hypothetical protein ABB37_00343 [Leptomonas pyrrhocoris]KPA86076.1 hypothetical protein ABB37_00343 [Leptomonas pyrrhocoris]|eukprot:XP_015664515.1 hypothetical protein ABB37_00343 [Leptomonas pyrrhocoris]